MTSRTRGYWRGREIAREHIAAGGPFDEMSGLEAPLDVLHGYIDQWAIHNRLTARETS